MTDPLRWATVGGSQIVEPPDAKKVQGHNAGEPTAAEFMNWWMNQIASKLNIGWGRAVQIGIDLTIASATGTVRLAALSNENVAYISDGDDDLRFYHFDGDVFAQVGNDLNIAGASGATIVALSATRVALIDGANEDLRAYDWDGADWAQVGNDLNIPGIGATTLAALSATRVAFIGSTLDELRTYDFDGTDWTLVGSGLPVSGYTGGRLTALNSSRVALVQTTPDKLETYDFDGAAWGKVGNTYTGSSFNTPDVTALNGTDIIVADPGGGFDELHVFRFDGADWSLVGLPTPFPAGSFGVGITALSGGTVAFIQDASQDIRVYEITFSLSAPYSVSGGAF